MNTASAHCRTAPRAPRPSETSSVPCTMAGLSWVASKPTSGCPSTATPKLGGEHPVPRLSKALRAQDTLFQASASQAQRRETCSSAPSGAVGLSGGAWQAPNQCDLNCLAEGHAFYHSFGRVLDGTPCSPGAPGLCVAGRCLSVGCDGLLGSDARQDRCGRCGGANDSCLFVQRVFRDTGSFAGYWNVTVIPEGARHLRVAHRSRNNLALMAPDGHYLLNGNRAVSPPGAYEVAGTRLVYTQEASLEETLQAEGPTSQDLILQVLLQEPNPGIEFEFWLPRERYGPFQAQTQALGWAPRQPQPRGLEPQPAARRTTPSASPPPSSAAAPDACPPCPDSRGRAHRIRHYCGSDFVLRARVLGLLQPPPQDTRYEVEVQQVYKQRSPLRTREYLWAPGRCPCPALGPGHDFLLAARRVLSPDRTRDRLLLPRNGYARPWSPAEDSRVRLAARRCQS
ncbi:ADAMTS-like protein 5 isoform X5 [Erinaceus europaeus]|uniref:ADAMTS-like protein 5 isoform X5 n=1 Tax=Erinaceus europaeus TaxID=9365 RepID=A0ABM3WLP1_ERIEU|nr:ADAMTS-like protein 5 isoform X5 [Erinaceus europaeus]